VTGRFEDNIVGVCARERRPRAVRERERERAKNTCGVSRYVAMVARSPVTRSQRPPRKRADAGVALT